MLDCKFKYGDCVVIKGKKDNFYNGQIGIVVGFSSSASTYPIPPPSAPPPYVEWYDVEFINGIDRKKNARDFQEEDLVAVPRIVQKYCI